jgi:hypothetical protein
VPRQSIEVRCLVFSSKEGNVPLGYYQQVKKYGELNRTETDLNRHWSSRKLSNSSTLEAYENENCNMIGSWPLTTGKYYVRLCGVRMRALE